MGLLKLHATRACGRSSTLTITYVTPHFGLQIHFLMSDNDAHDEMIYKTNPLLLFSGFWWFSRSYGALTTSRRQHLFKLSKIINQTIYDFKRSTNYLPKVCIETTIVDHFFRLNSTIFDSKQQSKLGKDFSFFQNGWIFWISAFWTI